ncbi:nuclear transport factor 2 family protein [Nonomuraea jabiensis]|uniref:nuclear transport factor 2 family protein n=1 Tax=Nonomuraea jabiensis TaxID=882448 RepID=UPI003D70BE67
MATDTQASRTVAEKFVERLGRQDPDGIQELFSEEIDWHVPGSDALPWTGRRTRREEVAPYFTTMWPHFAHGRSKVVTPLATSMAARRSTRSPCMRFGDRSRARSQGG